MKLKRAQQELEKRVASLEERLTAAETKLEQRYISDTTRQGGETDASVILSEYLFGKRPEAK